MNCLIVDDDACSRIDLEQKVSKISFLSHIGSIDSAEHTPDILRANRVDLLFLDVLDTDPARLKVLENFSPLPFHVILMSSDQKFTPRVYDRTTFDFLHKPVKDEHLLKVALRAYSRYNEKYNAKPGSQKNHLIIKTEGVYFRLEPSSIHYIEAISDHARVITDTGSFRINTSLKNISADIPTDSFCRIHNSFIVNVQKISGVEGNYVRVADKRIPVSRARHKSLIARTNFI